MLGVGNAMGMLGMRGSDGHVSKGVVDVATRRYQTGVAQELLTDLGIEMYRGRHRLLLG